MSGPQPPAGPQSLAGAGPQDAAAAPSATTDQADPAVQAAQSRVRQALDGLTHVQDAGPEDQVEAFANAQRALQATLSDIDND